MKIKLLALSFGLAALGMILLAAGCNSGGNQNGGTAAGDTKLADPACTNANINTMLTDVRTAVAKKIRDKGGLQSQLDNGFSYTIDIAPDNKSLIMTVYGGIGDKHGRDIQNSFDDFVGALKTFVRKSCTSSVIFLPGPAPSPGPATGPAPGPSSSPGTSPSDSNTVAYPGFRWFACEDPTRPCPNGTCAEVCMTTTRDEANGSANSNSSGSNSNSNVNGKSNSNKP